jgi:uracil DNA glycosylase
MILSGTHPAPLSGELGVFSLLHFLAISYRKILEKARPHTVQKM